MATKTAPRPAVAPTSSPADALPDDVGALKAIVARRDASIREKGFLIEKLRHQLAVLKRHRFGTKSEGLDSSTC